MLPPTVDSLIAATASVSATSAGVSGSWTLLVSYFFVAIGVSFFCSVWEAVLLSVTTPYVADLKNKRPAIGRTLEDLKSRINRPLTSILTLNTIAHTVGAMGVAAQVTALGGGKWDALAGALMTLAILIASEIIPKNLGARHWRAWAPWVSVTLKYLAKIMTPIIWFIELFSKGHQGEGAFNRDELKVMAEMGRRQGQLDENESRILDNLLQLREISVREVMTPRPVVFALPATMTVDQYVAEHENSPFSRVPVFIKNHDDIDGFVLVRDILLCAARGQTEQTLADLKRDLAVIPDSAPLPAAFQELVAKRDHIALVVGEFGGTAGIVTMEDVVETLLGLEIVDEADTREDMQAFARALWEKRAAAMRLKTEFEPRSE